MIVIAMLSLDKTVLSCTLETGVTCNYKPSICHIFVTACCAAMVILGIKKHFLTLVRDSYNIYMITRNSTNIQHRFIKSICVLAIYSNDVTARVLSPYTGPLKSQPNGTVAFPGIWNLKNIHSTHSRFGHNNMKGMTREKVIILK